MLSTADIVRAGALAVAAGEYLRRQHPSHHYGPRVGIAYILGGTYGRIADHVTSRPGRSTESRRNWTLLFRTHGARPGCDNCIERIIRMAIRASLGIDTVPGPEHDGHLPFITVDSCIIDMQCADVTDLKVSTVLARILQCPLTDRVSMGFAPKWFWFYLTRPKGDLLVYVTI